MYYRQFFFLIALFSFYYSPIATSQNINAINNVKITTSAAAVNSSSVARNQSLDPDDFSWLGYGSAASAYQPNDFSSFGNQYIIDAHIIKNWTSTRVSMPGRCAEGLEKNGELCYPQCKEGYVGNGPVCWKACPPGYTDDGAFCRRDRTHAKSSYGRGVGWIPPCRGNQFQAGLCYSHCESGYNGVGPVCWRTCDPGLVDTGAFCQDPHIKLFAKDSYGRGAGKPIIISHFEPVFNEKACGNNGWTGYAFEKNSAEYIVERNDQEKLSVFSFRGTQITSIADIFTDLDFHPWVANIGGESVSIHGGFYKHFKLLAEDFKQQLTQTPNDHKIVITGHSLGGAVATIAAAEAASWGGRKADVVINFGSPLVGDARFKSVYQKLVGCEKTSRIVNSADLIPKIPKVHGYQHVCEAKEANYASGNPLSDHDMFLGYKSVTEQLYGDQVISVFVKGCPSPIPNEFEAQRKFKKWLNVRKGIIGDIYYYVYPNTGTEAIFRLKTRKYSYFPAEGDPNNEYWDLIGPKNWGAPEQKGTPGNVYRYINTYIGPEEEEYFELLKEGTYSYFPTDKTDNVFWRYMFK